MWRMDKKEIKKYVYEKSGTLNWEMTIDEIQKYMYDKYGVLNFWNLNFWKKFTVLVFSIVLVCKVIKNEIQKYIYDKSGTFKFWFRFFILALFTTLSYITVFEINIVDHILKDPQKGTVLEYSLTTIVFGIIAGFGLFIIRTHDKRKEFKDAFQQQNETLFSNALQLLFKEDDKIANGVGLKELVKLKQSGAIYAERVDMITSTGLKLSQVPLSHANLQCADLSNADFRGADLSGVNMSSVNFIDANVMTNADWSNAHLYNTNLSGANLSSANLSSADLSGVNLSNVKLKGSDLSNTNLSNVHLYNTDLCDANLNGADLSDIDLSCGNMDNVKYNQKTLDDMEDCLFKETLERRGIKEK